MKLSRIFLLIALFTSHYAFAGDKIIGGLKIESYAIISSWGAHQPGNLELKIDGGFSIPSELSCSDSNYITTKNTVPGFDHMVSSAMTAFIAEKYVQLGLTDDPALTAFPGRCSLKAIVVHH